MFEDEDTIQPLDTKMESPRAPGSWMRQKPAMFPADCPEKEYAVNVKCELLIHCIQCSSDLRKNIWNTYLGLISHFPIYWEYSSHLTNIFFWRV